MKCIRCGHDSKYPQRQNRRCPQCKGEFAFEPRQGDPVTDRLFQSALEAVSAQGQVRFGFEHLYYEVCRRKRRRRLPTGVSLAMLSAGLTGVLVWLFDARLAPVAVIAGCAGAVGAFQLCRQSLGRTVPITPDTFSRLYDRWCQTHGVPEGVIRRRDEPVPPPQAEPDLGDYAFDRAVICDRARTVDLLLANNFHFENNCAILSVGGYPPGPFATVRAMLQRNPNLQVFVLHDASPQGCRLAQRLAHDREWFPAGIRMIDVGLRPGHARRFLGLWQRGAIGVVQAGDGLTAREATWLSSYSLELAAVRPAQVIRRLFRAINRQSTLSTDGVDGGGVWLFLDQDDTAFATDADALDASADTFG